VLLGGAVAGIVGALLALPAAAAVLLLVREVWVRRQEIA
jgi:predicted PurR-regulated permease PerM